MKSSPSIPDQPRLLNWEACINTRELGGYPVANGGNVRWKALLRSDNLALLSPESQKRLLGYGIRTIIDLRFPWELKEIPNPFATISEREVHYLNLPLDVDADLIWSAPQNRAIAMSKMYIELLEKNSSHVAAVLTAIARAKPGGVLFHCHAGKDRTGLIAALVLSALGVPREIVLADYSFESSQLIDWRKKILADPSLSSEKREYLEALSSSDLETMQRTLAYFDQKFGSVENYLLSTSLSKDDISLLRRRLVET